MTVPVGTLRRRRWVCVVTSLTGAGLLRAAMAAPSGSPAFYQRSLGVAAVWAAGARASGPVALGGARRDHLGGAVLLGCGGFAVCYGCALVARHIPVLASALSRVLAHAHHGSLPAVLVTTLANGAGEEAFFRGAVYAAAGGSHPVAASTALYSATNGATGNPALGLASLVLGAVWGLQRGATGGIAAPLVTHLTWSTLMVWLLPPLFPPPGAGEVTAARGDGVTAASARRRSAARHGARGSRPR